jgi:hypothetical protein
MLIVGVSLAWDTARRSQQGARAENGRAAVGEPERGPAAGRAAADPPVPEQTPASGAITGDMTPVAVAEVPGGVAAAAKVAPLARARRWRSRLPLLAWLAACALYVIVVGSFSRYSWPATLAVVGLGATVVVSGWTGPRHTRPAPGRPPIAGLALWGMVLVVGCLWELSSLLEQPSLTTDSYAHPTISTLTDPVLSSWVGRSVILVGWLGLGWLLVER